MIQLRLHCTLHTLQSTAYPPPPHPFHLPAADSSDGSESEQILWPAGSQSPSGGGVTTRLTAGHGPGVSVVMFLQHRESLRYLCRHDMQSFTLQKQLVRSQTANFKA